MRSVGLDVGSGAVKAAVMQDQTLLVSTFSRIRKRDVAAVVDEVFARAVRDAGVDEVDYIASTGEGEDFPLATGHFYGMTTHARGALFLEPRARFVLDVGALHARAVAMDERGKVLDYKMTSQCASGSGQFLENIARYLGVSLAEVGSLSQTSANPEGVSSICAVLAETDVINMVSRGIDTADILRGIHESMAGRFGKLLRSLNAEGVVFVSGGLSRDTGLLAALEAEAAKVDRRGRGGNVEIVTHPDAICAGAIGAALWGTYRHGVLGLEEAAWTQTSSSAR